MANKTYDDVANLIKTIETEIHQQYENYLKYLRENGQESFYYNQPSFVQRLMFFDYGRVSPYYYRNMIKDFIFDTHYPSDMRYDEASAETASHFDAKLEEKGIFVYWGASDLIKEMIKVKAQILKENPILTNNLPVNVREDLLNTILRNLPEYEALKKSVNKYINNLVARIITVKMRDVNREHKY